ncbi:MAG: alpha/beta hydrolase [Rhodobacteraceae bacterium]|nr:alpha/beta hydrolase [Paracoccaceae bacterium]
MNELNPDFVDVGRGAAQRRIAVVHAAGAQGETGDSSCGVFWLSGFKSDMQGSKAQALCAHARSKGFASTRFDYSGHGLSSGDFEQACVSDWLEEALCVFDRCCKQPTVIVGSSMGGWLALLLALARRETSLIKGLVLIAPATDFTEELMWKHRFTDEIRQVIERDGRWQQASEYSDDPYVITRKLIEDGRKHLLLDKPLFVGCPVTILQGQQDPDVPWQHAVRLSEALPRDDVTFSLIPDGDHRLSRPQDLALMIDAVDHHLGLA